MTKDIFASELANQRILVVGDVMIDSYLWGNVTRISPEAPVPIVSITRKEKRLGGAANVAFNIASLNATPIICSVLGNDDNAKDFLRIMYDHDMDKRGIVSSEGRMTTVKSRIIGNNMHIVRVDEETTATLTAHDEEQLIDRVECIVKRTPVNAIIFQDYDKGCITPNIIDRIINMARRRKIITTVDPKRRNFSYFHDVSLFKPNLKELKEGLNIDIDESSAIAMQHDLDKAAQLLHDRQNIEVVLITLSNKGVYACDFRSGHPQSFILPAQERSIADVSGAGDTVISVATLAMTMGLDLEEVVRYANLAGGIVCEQVGVVPIDKKRLLAEL